MDLVIIFSKTQGLEGRFFKNNYMVILMCKERSFLTA